MSDQKKNEHGYALSRLNAVRHGVLSKEVVLPHESKADYEMLLQAFYDEFTPKGVTECALAEELATILWRKRRVLQAEGVRINDGIKKSFDEPIPLVNTAVPFDLRIAGSVYDECVIPRKELLQICSGDHRAHLQKAMDELETLDRADEVLNARGHGAVQHAFEILPENVQLLWYKRERSSLSVKEFKKFLENEARPYLEQRKHIIENIAFVRQAAQGGGLTKGMFDSLIRYEAHLDRKFERTLSMLLKLKEIRAQSSPEKETVLLSK